MGLISNQWLNRGRGVRNRTYSPKRASISCEWNVGPWTDNNEVVIQLTGSKPDGEFQVMYLSRAEVDEVSVKLVSAMSAKAREQLLCQFLGGLTDAKLLRLLALDLRSRKRLPNERK